MTYFSSATNFTSSKSVDWLIFDPVFVFVLGGKSRPWRGALASLLEAFFVSYPSTLVVFAFANLILHLPIFAGRERSSEFVFVAYSDLPHHHFVLLLCVLFLGFLSAPWNGRAGDHRN